MFPFCLINASVTDAEGITSRLVSFPLSLFSSATLPFQWSFQRNKQDQFSLFFLLNRLLLFFFFLFVSCGSCRTDYVFHSHKLTPRWQQSGYIDGYSQTKTLLNVFHYYHYYYHFSGALQIPGLTRDLIFNNQTQQCFRTSEYRKLCFFLVCWS